MYPKSIRDVNKVLKEMGVEERLAHGKGYYYFYDGDAMSWPSSSVYIYRIDELSTQDWIATYKQLKGEYEKRSSKGISTLSDACGWISPDGIFNQTFEHIEFADNILSSEYPNMDNMDFDDEYDIMLDKGWIRVSSGTIDFNPNATSNAIAKAIQILNQEFNAGYNVAVIVDEERIIIDANDVVAKNEGLNLLRKYAYKIYSKPKEAVMKKKLNNRKVLSTKKNAWQDDDALTQYIGNTYQDNDDDRYEVYLSAGYIELIQNGKIVNQYEYPEQGEVAPLLNAQSAADEGVYFSDDGYIEFYKDGKIAYQLFFDNMHEVQETESMKNSIASTPDWTDESLVRTFVEELRKNDYDNDEIKDMLIERGVDQSLIEQNLKFNQAMTKTAGRIRYDYSNDVFELEDDSGEVVSIGNYETAREAYSVDDLLEATRQAGEWTQVGPELDDAYLNEELVMAKKAETRGIGDWTSVYDFVVNEMEMNRKSRKTKNELMELVEDKFGWNDIIEDAVRQAYTDVKSGVYSKKASNNIDPEVIINSIKDEFGDTIHFNSTVAYILEDENMHILLRILLDAKMIDSPKEPPFIDSDDTAELPTEEYEISNKLIEIYNGIKKSSMNNQIWFDNKVSLFKHAVEDEYAGTGLIEIFEATITSEDIIEAKKLFPEDLKEASDTEVKNFLYKKIKSGIGKKADYLDNAVKRIVEEYPETKIENLTLESYVDGTEGFHDEVNDVWYNLFGQVLRNPSEYDRGGEGYTPFGDESWSSKRSMKKKADDTVDYEYKPGRGKAPSKLEKTEIITELQGQASEAMTKLWNQSLKLREKKDKFLTLQSELNQYKKELAATEEATNEELQGYVKWTYESMAKLDHQLNTAYALKVKEQDILMAIQEEVRSIPAGDTRPVPKDAGTILQYLKDMGSVTEEQVQAIEAQIDKTNEAVVYVQDVTRKLHTWEPKKVDLKKIRRNTNKQAGILDWIKDFGASVKSFISNISDGVNAFMGYAEGVDEILAKY